MSGHRVRIVYGGPQGRAHALGLPVEGDELVEALALAWAEVVLGMTDVRVRKPAAGVLAETVDYVPDEDALARMLDAWQRARLETGS